MSRVKISNNIRKLYRFAFESTIDPDNNVFLKDYFFAIKSQRSNYSIDIYFYKASVGFVLLLNFYFLKWSDFLYTELDEPLEVSSISVDERNCFGAKWFVINRSAFRICAWHHKKYLKNKKLNFDNIIK